MVLDSAIRWGLTLAGALAAYVMGHGLIAEQRERLMAANGMMAADVDIPRIGDAGVQVPALYVAMAAVVIVTVVSLTILYKLFREQRTSQSSMNDTLQAMGKVITECSVKSAVAVEQCTDAAKCCAAALERCTAPKPRKRPGDA